MYSPACAPVGTGSEISVVNACPAGSVSRDSSARQKDAVEGVHEDLARMPFDVLDRVLSSSRSARGIRFLHDTLVSGIYISIRLVNRAVGVTADAILDAVETRRLRTTEMWDEP